MTDKDKAPDDATDGLTQQKKRARRRLVGAIALVLFAVITLPMVMDHQPRPSRHEIQVRIPSQETPSAAKKAPAAKVAAVPAVPVEPAPAADPKQAPIVSLAEKPSPPTAEKKTESKEADPKPPVAEKKPEPKPAAKDSEVERAQRALGGTAPEQWVLQLGAYQDTANVKALQVKIKELGYPSYTENVSTPAGARVRVRAGPFATQEAAAAAQARLKKIGAGGPPGGVIAKK